jgi:hypothetical protein
VLFSSLEDLKHAHIVLDLKLDDKLESAGSAPFTVLFYPNDDQKLHVQTRLTEGPLRN